MKGHAILLFSKRGFPWILVSLLCTLFGIALFVVDLWFLPGRFELTMMGSLNVYVFKQMRLAERCPGEARGEGY